MKVHREPHETFFVVVDKAYLQDMDLSLKAKGLLTLMLSLPDDWKYSIPGLTAICRESGIAVSSAIKELKAKGYLKVSKYNASSDEKGRFGYAYEIFERPVSPDPCFPHLDDPGLDDPDLEKPDLEEPALEEPALENTGLYKIINNQIIKDQIMNNQEHSHQIQGGAGGGSDKDDLDGEDGTEGTWRPKASIVPDAITCLTERGAEYGAATVSPTLRASAQTLSGAAGRPPTTDHRPATVPSVAYALRQGIALSENNLKELEDFADKLGDEAVVWAVDEALAGGKKFYAYVRGILSRRGAMGAKNMDDIRQMEERRHNGTDQCFGREGPGDAPGRFDCDITV